MYAGPMCAGVLDSMGPGRQPKCAERTGCRRPGASSAPRFADHRRHPPEHPRMDESLHPALPWPGFTPERSFVLPLQAELMATPFGDTCEIDGIRLGRKSEFHVTVLSQDMSRAAGGLGEARLRTLFESQQW